MKSKLWVLLYVLVLVIMVVQEYQQDDYEVDMLSHRDYSIEENRALDALLLDYVKPLEFNLNNNERWGIFFKKVKEVPKLKDENKTKLVDVTLKEKTLCIEKECFRLLGVFSEQGSYQASFYNEKAKEKLKRFSKGEFMLESLYVKKIRDNEVSLAELNTTREWKIKLFDINSSQYKPKDFE